MPNRRPTRGAPAGRSPATAEAYTPTLGTLHAGDRALDGGGSTGRRRQSTIRVGRSAFAGSRCVRLGGRRLRPLGHLGLRVDRYVQRSERGCTRLGGRRASPGGRASGGPAIRHGLHLLPSDGRGSAPAAWRCAPSEGAPPAGQARFARVLRAAGARFTRLRPSGFACGAGSLRSRSTGRRRPYGRGSALRASPAEQGRCAPAPRAGGARFTRSALRASLRDRRASRASRAVRTSRLDALGARRLGSGARPIAPTPQGPAPSGPSMPLGGLRGSTLPRQPRRSRRRRYGSSPRIAYSG